MESKKMKVAFYGAAGEVTGSNFLIEVEGRKILIDCGFFQGGKIGDDKNYDKFAYDPGEIEALFVTHAHLDHIGRIPKLSKEGFKGKIYSTHPTRNIAEFMLIDSMGVLAKEAAQGGAPALYSEEDVRLSMKLWEGFEYHEPITIGGLTFVFRDAGHILGSAMVEITYNGKKILFTGDLGNSPAPLLKDTEEISDITYLVMESVYGDRNHEPLHERKRRTEEVIEDTVVAGGALMIPAFSLERTQDLLFEINNLVEHKRIPSVPFFLDSPLAIKVTEVYKESEKYYNKETRSIIKSGDDIFNFPGLRVVSKTEDSKDIRNFPNPKIIMAGSGMSNGGRIIHHEKIYLSDPKSTLLLVGYQAAGTMGRQLQDGAKQVRILGQDVEVRARIVNITGYSAHKDSDNLFQFVEPTTDTLKKVFVVHGEPKASLYLVQRLRDYLGLNAEMPLEGDVVELEF